VTVVPSGLATQPIGEAAPVAEGIWQPNLPVPFLLRFVRVYLVEGNDGWTLVDAGYDYHPDHIGAARWLHERTGAPVCMM
jgi:glyoxylase-like metal-dependent hydrolase (beta-lactamase superfamily II)